MALTLFQQIDGMSATYVLSWVYVGKSDDRYESRGTWARSVGIPIDADANVISLDADATEDMRHYVAFGDDLLLLLGPNREPRVGNASHAFTLSRTE